MVLWNFFIVFLVIFQFLDEFRWFWMDLMPPSMIFDDFERFCIHGESKATPGATKMNAFLYIFAGQSTARVFDQCNTGPRIFCGHFVMNFRRFWTIFASMAWAKQHREGQKLTQFDAFLQVKRRRAFLTIATEACMFFRADFAVILDAFWRHFAWFWAPIWMPDLGVWMVLGAGQNS